MQGAGYAFGACARLLACFRLGLLCLFGARNAELGVRATGTTNWTISLRSLWCGARRATVRFEDARDALGGAPGNNVSGRRQGSLAIRVRLLLPCRLLPC